MARVVVVGDGPAGLSAGLFLAKNGQDTIVFGIDDTAMHYAHLHNYLDVDDVGGTEFQQRARRQAIDHGVDLRAVEVTKVEASDGGFVVRAADEEVSADYVVLAGGKTAQRLAVALGV